MSVLTKKIRIVESVFGGYGYIKAHYDFVKNEPIFQNQRYVWSRDQLQRWCLPQTMMRHSSMNKKGLCDE